jgi:endonuclease YncB( thermonuclease family)
MATDLNPYVYRVQEIIRAVDGDTIECRISVGFGWSGTMSFRLAHIDTAEMRGVNASPAGREHWEFVKEWLENHSPLLVRTFKGSQSTVGIGDGHFGRWLAEFHSYDGYSLHEDLVIAFGESVRSK